jgi:anthranilate phosphoribosyltransferase
MTPEAAIAQVVGGASLAEDEMAVMERLQGAMTPAQVAGLAIARMKGETVDELWARRGRSART